jgi:hypothetical protein
MPIVLREDELPRGNTPGCWKARAGLWVVTKDTEKIELGTIIVSPWNWFLAEHKVEERRSHNGSSRQIPIETDRGQGVGGHDCDPRLHRPAASSVWINDNTQRVVWSHNAI